MRQLIRTYSITGAHEVTITGYTFTKQDIRLIIDETLASNASTDELLISSVLVSSTKKANVVSVVSGVITLANTTAVLTVGDELTIEIDIDDVAKESNATTNKQAILDALAAAKLAIQGNDATATLFALKTAIANLPTVALIQNSLAQETSVKDGNDTAIAVAKAIQDAVGSAPAGSEITTLFAWLTTIYEYLAGQTPEEIPEGLGDRINLLLQFFGLPQALPEYQSMTEQEGRAINDDLWEVFYGFNTAKVKIHIKISENEDFASYVWLDTSKTYGDYYSELYDAEGNSVLTDNPEETDPVTELYTYIVE